MEGKSGPHRACRRPDACQSKGKGLCRSCNIVAINAEISDDPNVKEARRSRLNKYRDDPAFRERRRQRLAQLHKDPVFAEAHRARSSAMMRSLNFSPEIQELKRLERALRKRKPRSSVAEATKELLAAKNRPMTNTEIAEHLKAAGMKISSVDPNNTIGSAITRRSNKVGDIVRVEKGVWGLREWYPTDARRN